MEITRYDDARRFYAETGHFLLQHEADHNLLLGIAGELIDESTNRYDSFYLAAVRDAGDIVAVVLRTPPHNLHLSLAAPEALPLVVNDVRAVYENLPGAMGPKHVTRSFVSLWEQASGQKSRPRIAQRIYALEQVTPVTNVPGMMRSAARGDRELLVRWLTEFDIEAFGEGSPEENERGLDAIFASPVRRLVLWDHDGSVSMAGASGATPNGIRIGHVYTPRHLRGRGYASACVAALSQQMLDAGYRYCYLFTDLANPTANHIYQNIGYQPVIDVDEFEFLAP